MAFANILIVGFKAFVTENGAKRSLNQCPAKKGIAVRPQRTFAYLFAGRPFSWYQSGVGNQRRAFRNRARLSISEATIYFNSLLFFKPDTVDNSSMSSV